jgi:hypothetical protein
MKTIGGSLNIEKRNDGGIGIYYETEASHNTLMLSKDEMIKVMGWLMTYLNGQDKKE